MADRILTAVYDNASDAEAARAALASAVPNADVTVRGSGDTADTGGFWEDLKRLFVPDDDQAVYGESIRRGGCLLTAEVPADMEDQALDILEQTNAVDVGARSAQWREEGWQVGTSDTASAAPGSELAVGSSGLVAPTPGVAFDAAQQAGLGEERSTATGYESTATTGAGDREAASAGRGENEAIPVLEEELRVGKREVGRGSVRVRSYVVERPVEEQVELRQEHVTIERRPVDRDIAPGEAAFQERTIEAVERGEEAVVSKSARVIEEINVRKDVDRDVETVRDSIRKTEVEIDDDRAGHAVTTTRDAKVGVD